MREEILFISNGHGEDIIGARIIEEILDNGGDPGIKVLPIVGEGRAYESLPVEIIGPRRLLPSGGFVRNGFRYLIKDIKAGLAGLTIEQIRLLKGLDNKIKPAVVVGDIYPLLLAGLFVGREIIFLPTAKSEYINGHYWIENMIMKKMAGIVFPRDRKTADKLYKSGVNAVYVGNVMMDCIDIKGVDLNPEGNSKIIGILPGSREEAYQNMVSILNVIKKLNQEYEHNITYLAAIAANLSPEVFRRIIPRTSFNQVVVTKEEEAAGVSMKLELTDSKSIIKLVSHHFGDVIDQSELVIGMAGTANEQAAGLGKPVVIFPGEGSQFTPAFARKQKKLLGDSVAFVEKDAGLIAAKIINILDDNELYMKMSRAGKKRMGKPGAAGKIADTVHSYRRRSIDE